MESLFGCFSDNDDPGYLSVAKHSEYKPIRPLIDNFWNIYEPYADSHFAVHLKKDFRSRAWELWLGNILLKQGYTLEKRKATDWPDFVVNYKNQRLYIEAICPSNASEESGNEIPKLNPFVFQELRSDLYELRIQNAILKKYQRKYIAKIEEQSIPYIIAINICKLPFSRLAFGDLPWIVKSLYPIGPERAIINDNQTFNTLRERKYVNAKSTGFTLDKTIFSSNKYSLISAIIYSDIPISLEHGKLTNGIYIIRNHYAINPINDTLGLDELIVEYNEDSLMWFLKSNSCIQQSL